MKIALLTSSIVAACVMGCGGASYSTSPASTPPGGVLPPNNITVSNNAYSPTPKTVTAGTTVTWTWRTCTGDTYSGQACVTHNVTFDDGVSSPSQDNGSFTRTFAAPGTYNYHCTLHAMSGQVQVTQ